MSICFLLQLPYTYDKMNKQSSYFRDNEFDSFPIPMILLPKLVIFNAPLFSPLPPNYINLHYKLFKYIFK